MTGYFQIPTPVCEGLSEQDAARVAGFVHEVRRLSNRIGQYEEDAAWAEGICWDLRARASARKARDLRADVATCVLEIDRIVRGAA